LKWETQRGASQCSLPELEVEVRRHREFLANTGFDTLTRR
jgi:hypothetical protein